MTKLNIKQINQIKELYPGLTDLKIGQIFNVTKDTIVYWRKKLNIQTAKHNSKGGRVVSKATRELLSVQKIGEKNPNWAGDEVKMGALHYWVKRRKPKPKFCEECGRDPPRDLANISQAYKRDIDDYRWLCRKCHMKSDGRFLNLKKGQGWSKGLTKDNHPGLKRTSEKMMGDKNPMHGTMGGFYNKKHSVESKELMRNNNLGEKNPMYGKKSWNNGLTKETDDRVKKCSEKLKGQKKEKLSETRKRLFKEGKLKNWNDGLTKETDKRVEKNANSISKTRIQLFKEGKLVGRGIKK